MNEKSEIKYPGPTYPNEVGPVKGFFIAMQLLALACVGGVIFLILFAGALRLLAQAIGYGLGMGW